MPQETPPEPSQADSAVSERWEFAVALLVIVALLGFCTGGPILLGLSLGPGIGTAASLLGCVA